MLAVSLILSPLRTHTLTYSLRTHWDDIFIPSPICFFFHYTKTSIFTRYSALIALPITSLCSSLCRGSFEVLFSSTDRELRNAQLRAAFRLRLAYFARACFALLAPLQPAVCTIDFGCDVGLVCLFFFEFSASFARYRVRSRRMPFFYPKVLLNHLLEPYSGPLFGI